MRGSIESGNRKWKLFSSFSYCPLFEILSISISMVVQCVSSTSLVGCFISVTVKLISIKFQINLFTWHDPPSIGLLDGLLSILSTWQNVPLFVLPIAIRCSCCWSPLHCEDIRYRTHSLNLPKTDAIHFQGLDSCCFCVVGITDTSLHGPFYINLSVNLLCCILFGRYHRKWRN